MAERSQIQYQPITGPVWRETVAEKLAWMPAGMHQPQRSLNRTLSYAFRLDPIPPPNPAHMAWVPVAAYSGRVIARSINDRSIYPLQPPAAAPYDPVNLEWMPSGHQPQRGLAYSLVREYRIDPIPPPDPAHLAWAPAAHYFGRKLERARVDWTVYPLQQPVAPPYDPQNLEWISQIQQPQRSLQYSILRSYVLDPIPPVNPAHLSWIPIDDYRGLALSRIRMDWSLYPLQPPAPYDPRNLEWQAVASYRGQPIPRSINGFSLYPPQDVIPPDPPPAPAESTATPGRVLYTGLTGRRYLRDEEKDEVVSRETVVQDTEFARESKRLSAALANLAAEREALKSSIASLENLKTARNQRRILLKKQELQLNAAKEALVREELEVLDVVCCAAAVMGMM